MSKFIIPISIRYKIEGGYMMPKVSTRDILPKTITMEAGDSIKFKTKINGGDHVFRAACQSDSNILSQAVDDEGNHITAFSIQHSAFSIQHSAFSIQHSAFSIQHI